jgi:hypothetical protein
MRRAVLPSDDDVRAAAGELLNAHLTGGPYPSVSSLANRFGVNRTTFYRHYSPIAAAITRSAAYAPKTVTYDVISKSTKNALGCSPSKTAGRSNNSNR